MLTFYDFQFAFGVAKIDFFGKLESLAFPDTFFHNEM